MHIVRFCFAIVGTQAHAAEPDRRDLVFFAVGCDDDIAGIEFEDLLPAYLGRARPRPSVMYRVCPPSWECQALRALGVKWTAATFS